MAANQGSHVTASETVDAVLTIKLDHLGSCSDHLAVASDLGTNSKQCDRGSPVVPGPPLVNSCVYTRLSLGRSVIFTTRDLACLLGRGLALNVFVSRLKQRTQIGSFQIANRRGLDRTGLTPQDERQQDSS